ncbi:helix-turn-helix domain-containing protein [Frondihabitans cladoniiphilus]|uniref:Helix-turn-helix domain-containing protein n=1 Tax=Frondihabitans cladoniiphilus TaxID=715785 RepID=A0ABP8W1B5_9MICO
MTVHDQKRRSKTYLPDDSNHDAFEDFVQQLEHFANKQTRLTSAEGDEVLLPEPLFDVLRRVANALASGHGVTVMPQATRLTTQQAAEILGTSRPTLIKLLEGGSIPFELVGRHRRVTLSDLDDYRAQAAADRRALLRRIAREGQAEGMLDVTADDLPPR